MSGSSPGREALDPDMVTKDVGVQADIPHTSAYCVRIPRWSVWLGAAIVGLLAIYLGADYAVSLYRPRWEVDSATLEDMGVDGVVLFRKHDRDNDGVLSLEEFEPLAHQIVDHHTHVSKIHGCVNLLGFIISCSSDS